MSLALSGPHTDSSHDPSHSAYRDNDFLSTTVQHTRAVNSAGIACEALTKSSQAIGRLQHPTSLFTHTTSPVHQSTVSTPNLEPTASTSSFSSMSYPSTPASFGTCPYLPQQHPAAMKTSYSNETRAGGEYLRVDFNPIIESLNFMPNSSTYDALTTSNFGTWSLNAMDTDNGLKTRLGFGLPCQTEDYCNQLSTPSEHPYQGNNRRVNTSNRPSNASRVDLMAHPGNHSFEEHHFDPATERQYNQKMLFNLNPTTPINTSTNTRTGLDLTRNGTEPNANSLLRSRTTNPISSKQNQGLGLVTNENPLSHPVHMTPDSSTTGFLTHKFGVSSDDGEISPTPTNTSSQTRTTGRVRKAAPTLATGRRNLKNEPVDPDEADRRMKRRERNRKSAQKCRERKVQRTQELQAQVEALQREISRLLQERDTLRNEARQFVTLLQVHCPGVAIPYMSCLNEASETLELRRDPHSLSMPPMTPVKSEVPHEVSTPDWRFKTTGQMEGASERVTVNASNDTYLSSMLPMQSHLSLNRLKTSMFTFQLDEAMGSEKNGCLSTPVLTQQRVVSHHSADVTSQDSSAMVPVSVRGLASASSSSPGSNYELSFNTNEGPTSLSNPLELGMELIPTTPASGKDQNPMLLHSPASLTSVAPMSVKALTPNGENQKGEDWDHLHSVKSDHSSPRHNAIPAQHYNIGSNDMASRSDAQRLEHQARVANSCYS